MPGSEALAENLRAPAFNRFASTAVQTPPHCTRDAVICKAFSPSTGPATWARLSLLPLSSLKTPTFLSDSTWDQSWITTAPAEQARNPNKTALIRILRMTNLPV